MNETIQICGITNYFVITGIVLSGLWAGAYILSWLIQWAWAWVDEAKVDKGNWVVNLFERAKPTLPDGWVRTNASYIYSQYDEDGVRLNRTDNISRILSGKDLERYVAWDSDFYNYVFFLPLIWISMLCLNFWYISMYFGLFFAIAFSTRMSRRGYKALTAHIADKDAHKD